VRLSGALLKAQEHVTNIASESRTHHFFSFTHPHRLSPDLWGEQPKHDQIPWSEGLKEYGGLLTQFVGCITSSRSASQRYVEVDSVS
jgi:hypothetical protein